MCRSPSPLFGAPVFRRFSGEEFARRCGQPSAFRQEGMSHMVTMSADAEYRLVRGGQDGRGKHIYQLPDVLVREPRTSQVWFTDSPRTERNAAGEVNGHA